MTDELNPTTPAQAIAAGLDVNPSTKLEYFLKHGGSGGGVYVVNATVDLTTYKVTCDKTAGEMWNAAENGGIIVISFDLTVGENSTAIRGVAQASVEYNAEEDETSYTFALTPHPFQSSSSGWRFEAESASDYPEASLM